MATGHPNTRPDVAIRRYENFLGEIKHRLQIIDICIKTRNNSTSISGFREIDIELCYLNLRKILELMAYASLSAFSRSGSDLQAKILTKEYNAVKIVRYISKINKNFYPKPMRIIEIDPKGERRVEAIEDGFLTLNDFVTLYDRKCPKMLHANRSDIFSERHDLYYQEVILYYDKIIQLLSHHWMEISENTTVGAMMFFGSDRAVSAAILQKLERSSS